MPQLPAVLKSPTVSVLHLMSLGSCKYWQSATAVPLPYRQGRQFYYLNSFCDLYPSIPFILPQDRPSEKLLLTVQISRGPYGENVLSSRPIETRATVNHGFSVPRSILWLHGCMVNALHRSRSPQYSLDWLSGVWLALLMSSDQDAVTRRSNGPPGELDRSFARSQWWTEYRSGSAYRGHMGEVWPDALDFYLKQRVYPATLLRTSHRRLLFHNRPIN